ncbi:MAG: hypothetical protein ABFE07_00090 [Armatimonadia bacterium]
MRLVVGEGMLASGQLLLDEEATVLDAHLDQERAGGDEAGDVGDVEVFVDVRNCLVK